VAITTRAVIAADREGLMRNLVHAPVRKSILVRDATHFIPFEKHGFGFFETIQQFLKE
jgi:hypothetical protein